MKLLELWKKGRATFWKKVKLFFSWLIGWPVRLSWPVTNCQKFKKVKNSLIGHSYYFIRPRGYKVRSPLSGKIEKIHMSQTIHLINDQGLQVIISIDFDKNNLLSMFDVIKCLAKEGQKVDSNTVLFLIFFPSKVLRLSVFVPWQPQLLGKVKELPTFLGKDFVSLYYRNPLNKNLKIKRHREYHY